MFYNDIGVYSTNNGGKPMDNVTVKLDYNASNQLREVMSNLKVLNQHLSNINDNLAMIVDTLNKRSSF